MRVQSTAILKINMLLLYLSSWYWTWVEYKIVINTHSIDDTQKN